jgi:hypothetical protein
MSTGAVMGLEWVAILVGAVGGYAGWPWWIGPAIGAAAGLISLGPALSDPSVRIAGLVSGAAFNLGLFGALPFGVYALMSWLVGR